MSTGSSVAADSNGHDQELRYCAPFAESAAIRLLIAEDQPVFQEGLCMILRAQPDMLAIATALTDRAAVAEFRRYEPDVTLMSQSIRSAGGGNSDALVTIRKEFPGARIILLATSDGDAEIRSALRAGAASYVLKTTSGSQLVTIIRAIHRGKMLIPVDVSARLAEHMGFEDLTPREIDVLRLARDGNRNKQIADRLLIAETTVNFHMRNLIGKLQANDKTHAVTLAIQRGLLPV
jgi:DNA-binding NarL/FixJ family response regulator